MQSECKDQGSNIIFSLLVCLYLLLLQKALTVPLWVSNPHIGSMDGTIDIVFGNGSLNYPSEPTNSILFLVFCLFVFLTAEVIYLFIYFNFLLFPFFIYFY